MKKKKKKKIVGKRRVQRRTKKQKKAKSGADRPIQDFPFMGRLPFSEIGNPSDFRPVSMSQALMEFSNPLMDFVDNGIVKDPNEALQLGMALWNYKVTGEPPELREAKEKLIKLIGDILKMEPQEAAEFFDKMCQRKDYLLPPGMQPPGSMTMLIRKEKRYSITPFDYDSLNISEETYQPDKKDETLLQFLDRVDVYNVEVIDEDWKKNYVSMEEKCRERFKKWLIFKGAKEYSEYFPFKIGAYFNYIYRYCGENPKTVSAIDIEEFFMDYLLRKVTEVPPEYTEWPAVLKLFYQFLAEIGYLKGPEKMIKFLAEIEPRFIEVLRERYS
jgi:hypothetical protein